MTQAEREARVDLLDAAIREDRVLRKAWSREDGGRHLACLLATVAPEVLTGRGESGTPERCPSWLMPGWLAHLTPWIDDAGTADAWPSHVREFARLLRASEAMTPEKWSRLGYRFRRRCVLEARSHLPAGHAALPSIDAVIALLDRAVSGDVVTTQEWAEASASAAAWAASAAAWAASWAAAASASAAAWAASASAAAWAAAASASAWAAASDRLIAGLFADWQAEIGGAS